MEYTTTAQFLGSHQWLHGHCTALSHGKPPKWAEVRRETETTLAALLKGQTNTPREGRLTGAEYHNATDEAKKADKSAFAWFSLAHYENSHRNADNWKGSNCVVLDADGKTPTGETRYFTRGELRERFDGLRFIALPSHSFTVDCPRWRIVIPLSETIIDRGEYAAAAKHLAGRLDMCVDGKSYTPEQLWFVMSAPKGEWATHVAQIVVGG